MNIFKTVSTRMGICQAAKASLDHYLVLVVVRGARKVPEARPLSSAAGVGDGWGPL